MHDLTNYKAKWKHSYFPCSPPITSLHFRNLIINKHTLIKKITIRISRWFNSKHPRKAQTNNNVYNYYPTITDEWSASTRNRPTMEKWSCLSSTATWSSVRTASHLCAALSASTLKNFATKRSEKTLGIHRTHKLNYWSPNAHKPASTHYLPHVYIHVIIGAYKPPTSNILSLVWLCELCANYCCAQI